MYKVSHRIAHQVGTLIYGNQTFSSTSLKGVGEQYFDVDGLKLKSGNLFSAQDVADNNQVALIDESAKSQFSRMKILSAKL